MRTFGVELIAQLSGALVVGGACFFELLAVAGGRLGGRLVPLRQQPLQLAPEGIGLFVVAGAFGLEPVGVLLLDGRQVAGVDSRCPRLLQRLNVLRALGGQLQLVSRTLGFRSSAACLALMASVRSPDARFHRASRAASSFGRQRSLWRARSCSSSFAATARLGLDGVVGASHVRVQLLLMPLALCVDRASGARPLLFEVLGQPGPLGAQLCSSFARIASSASSAPAAACSAFARSP